MPDRKNRRALAAEETQEAIVEAAQALFVERGYQATTIADIARASGVAVQTVYNAVGSKRAVLERVLNQEASGPQAPTPVPVFMRERAEQARSGRELLGLLADLWAGTLPRTAPVFAVIREAAAVDPKMAEFERDRAAQRLRNYQHAGTTLRDRGWLRDGVSSSDAAATIFAIGHPEVFRALVLEAGWSVERFCAWALERLCDALLAPVQ
jgi:AcrR family transcriptional regulator